MRFCSAFWTQRLRRIKNIRYNVSATREVILSADAIGTPQILMCSEISRSLDLAAVGI